VAITPDGAFAYVANYNFGLPGSVSVIDTVSVGSGPTGVAITPEPFVYVANFNDGSVSVIDTATDTVVATVPVGSAPIGVAITPDGVFAYVTSYTPGSVSVINTGSNTVVDTVPAGTGTWGVAITPF
jgi:YVTN family beta-propeller protein